MIYAYALYESNENRIICLLLWWWGVISCVAATSHTSDGSSNMVSFDCCFWKLKGMTPSTDERQVAHFLTILPRGHFGKEHCPRTVTTPRYNGSRNRGTALHHFKNHFIINTNTKKESWIYVHKNREHKNVEIQQLNHIVRVSCVCCTNYKT